MVKLVAYQKPFYYVNPKLSKHYDDTHINVT